jgi:Uncharacterised conserved protein (DUF2371)
MKKRTVIVGLVVLILGVAFIAGGSYGLKNVSSRTATFTQQGTGEYVSSEMLLNSSNVVVVKPAAATGGMVSAQDLDKVNTSDVGSYTVPSNSSASGADTYLGLKGGFYYVVFSSSQPTTRIVVAGNLATTAAVGLLVLLGFVLVIVGIIVAVVGLRRKDRQKQIGVSEDEYYAKRSAGPQPGQ